MSARRIRPSVIVAALLAVGVVVWLASGQMEQPMGGGGLPEVFNKFAVEVTNLLRRKIGLEDHEISTAQINRSCDQRLFHWQGEMAIAANSSFVP